MDVRSFNLTTLALVLALGLVGCGSSDDDDDSNAGDNESDSGMTSTPVDGSDTGNGSDSDSTGVLDGTWVSECDDDNIEILTFSGNAVVSTATYYDPESNCTELDPDESVEATEASLEFVEGSTTTNLGTASWIDVTIESITIDGQPLSPEELQTVEAGGGFDKFFDIYLIANDGTLFFGDKEPEDASETPETRPTQLDSLSFIRQ